MANNIYKISETIFYICCNISSKLAFSLAYSKLHMGLKFLLYKARHIPTMQKNMFFLKDELVGGLKGSETRNPTSPICVLG
jgi:hypothetical protein